MKANDSSSIGARRPSKALCTLPFLLPANAGAFSSAGPARPPRTRLRRTFWSRAAVRKDDKRRPNAVPRHAKAVPPQNCCSSFRPRPLDRKALVNVSMIAIAVVLVTVQVLFVNTGITRGWSPEEIAFRVPIDSWRSYNEILTMAPVQTKAVTSATVYTIGDIIAQRAEGVEIGELNRGRIARSLAAGLIGHGPLSHVWYQVSEDFFDSVLHWTEWWSFVPKVVVDQILWGPFWNNTYIVFLGVMQFQRPSEIWSDIRRTTIPLIVSGLKLWPLAHCVTYGVVPVENRLLWVDLVEIIWVTILATEASGGEDDDK